VQNEANGGIGPLGVQVIRLGNAVSQNDDTSSDGSGWRQEHPIQDMLFPTKIRDGVGLSSGLSGGSVNGPIVLPDAVAGAGAGEEAVQQEAQQQDTAGGDRRKNRAYISSLIRVNASIIVFTVAHVMLWACLMSYRISITLDQQRATRSYITWTDCAFDHFDANHPSEWMTVCGKVPHYRITVVSTAVAVAAVGIYGALVSFMHFSSMVRQALDSDFMWDVYDCILMALDYMGCGFCLEYFGLDDDDYYSSAPQGMSQIRSARSSRVDRVRSDVHNLVERQNHGP
jgi:hypothetical protein